MEEMLVNNINKNYIIAGSDKLFGRVTCIIVKLNTAKVNERSSKTAA